MRPISLATVNHCSCCVRVFHHILVNYGHENAEMQKRKFDDVTLQYSIEDFHDAKRTPCALRADAMLDIFLRGAV